MTRTPWIFALLIPSFVKGCVYPGWSSSLELALFCSLIAVVLFRPLPKSVEQKKLDELEQKLHAMHDAFTQLKMKIGLKI